MRSLTLRFFASSAIDFAVFASWASLAAYAGRRWGSMMKAATASTMMIFSVESHGKATSDGVSS